MCHIACVHYVNESTPCTNSVYFSILPSSFRESWTVILPEIIPCHHIACHFIRVVGGPSKTRKHYKECKNEWNAPNNASSLLFIYSIGSILSPLFIGDDCGLFVGLAEADGARWSEVLWPTEPSVDLGPGTDVPSHVSHPW